MKSSISLYILALATLIACQTDKQSSQHTEMPLGEEGIPDMSIYHLPDSWTTQHGDSISFVDLKGDPLVVVMIYTACRTACPRLVADMRQIEQKVIKETEQSVKYVLVSIDPENDTPEKLLKFAEENGMHGEQWLFLRGTKDGVREFANILSVKYKKINPIDFSHSNIISVFDAQGVLKYQKEGLGLENNEIVKHVASIAGN
ncbi:SCO family protein [Pleomorphovibrio marinus]|uniref:SCO family protein n=1 Tax=Pleomorphovibrio marinus TaxID=2164132 RepID=UPI000E0AB429|nr:SCO family protein [Pleomorphovibrio marinus]